MHFDHFAYGAIIFKTKPPTELNRTDFKNKTPTIRLGGADMSSHPLIHNGAGIGPKWMFCVAHRKLSGVKTTLGQTQWYFCSLRNS